MTVKSARTKELMRSRTTARHMSNLSSIWALA